MAMQQVGQGRGDGEWRAYGGEWFGGGNLSRKSKSKNKQPKAVMLMKMAGPDQMPNYLGGKGMMLVAHRSCDLDHPQILASAGSVLWQSSHTLTK
mmetsp:Transcript_18732/g.53880  ORF Transcript_18732/g.53880 Transcript_18732/m.53880 type:complete len:95 (+) Transcript_18732:732-1016(+)